MYAAGDFVVDLQNNEKLFELQEPMLYKEKKGLYIGRAYDLKKKQQCYLKFTDDTGKNLTNLRREGRFSFFFPYIEHIYGTFQGISPDHRQIFGINAEYVQGEDLSQARLKLRKEVQKGKITEDEEERIVFRQMMQLLYGMECYMEYANPRFLHRDIKPENIMVQTKRAVPGKKEKTIDGSGDIKLIDFDFAHISGSRQTINAEADLGYTLGYMSPRGLKRAIMGRNPDETDEIYAAGRVFCFWLNADHYFRESEIGITKTRENEDDTKKEKESPDYLENEELGYGLRAERFVPRYRDFAGGFNQKYTELIRIIKKMCCNPAKEEPYSSPTEIIKDMQKFLLRYYGNDIEMYQEYMGIDRIPLFQEEIKRDHSSSVMVGSKILRSGEAKRARMLHEYTMRDIKIDGKVEMVLYNIDGNIYYISMPGIQLFSRHETGEYRVCDKDIFINKEGIRIQFFV